MISWTALLDGPLRERALKDVEEIAGALGPPLELEDVSLANGKTGLALLFAELERGQPGRGYGSFAERLIGEAAQALAERPLPPWLYAGFSGITWAIERLGALGLTSPDDLGEIDEVLLGLVSRRPWEGPYDLIAGLSGLGVYALDRLPRPAAAACLERIVDRLEEGSVRSSEGVAWWTPPDDQPLHLRSEFPEGYFNLGASHGIPAAVALLALIARAGVAERRARALAADGARWLLGNALTDSPGARFPACVAPGHPPTATRSAWCYGDPGVALCLLVAARALSDGALEQAALEIAREAARRPAEGTGVTDAGLCHGAAGLGHVFNRLYQATGAPALREAALAWFTRALDLKRPGQPLGGYLAWTLLPGGQYGWVPLPGLLEGAAGIALALLSASHPLPPGWDGLLMAAIPDQGPAHG